MRITRGYPSVIGFTSATTVSSRSSSTRRRPVHASNPTNPPESQDHHSGIAHRGVSPALDPSDVVFLTCSIGRSQSLVLRERSFEDDCGTSSSTAPARPNSASSSSSAVRAQNTPQLGQSNRYRWPGTSTNMCSPATSHGPQFGHVVATMAPTGTAYKDRYMRASKGLCNQVQAFRVGAPNRAVTDGDQPPVAHLLAMTGAMGPRSPSDPRTVAVLRLRRRGRAQYRSRH